MLLSSMIAGGNKLQTGKYDYKKTSYKQRIETFEAAAKT